MRIGNYTNNFRYEFTLILNRKKNEGNKLKIDVLKMNKCEVVQTSSEFLYYFFLVFRFDIKYRLRGSNIELLLARTPIDVKLAAVWSGSAVNESDCRLHCERHLLAAKSQPRLA